MQIVEGVPPRPSLCHGNLVTRLTHTGSPLDEILLLILSPPLTPNVMQLHSIIPLNLNAIVT